MLLEQYSKNNNQVFNEKKLNDFIENERKMHEELDKLKQERDRASF